MSCIFSQCLQLKEIIICFVCITGQLFVKWVCTSIGKSLELYDLDLNMLERLISEVCTHLIAAGVMKQITDCDEKTKDVFCVSFIVNLIK